MDYTRYVVEEQLKELHIMQKHEVTQMMYEAAFLESCYETGIIGVLEATEDNLFKGLIDALKMFFTNLKSAFKRRSIALYNEKFDDDVISEMRANLGKMQNNARKLSPRKDVPHWKGNVTEQSKAILTAVNQALTNIKDNNIKDYTYANALLGSTSGTNLLNNQDTAMGQYLNNYFRYGGVGDAETKRVTISGNDIAGMLDTMIDYIAKYNKDYAPLPGQTSDKITNAIDRAQLEEDERKQKTNSVTSSTPSNDNKPANESLSSNLYLSIEQKYVYETLLPIMVNYNDVVIEENQPDNNNSNNNNDKNKQTNEAKKVEQAKEKAKKEGTNNVTKSMPKDEKAEAEQQTENKEGNDTKISSKNYFSRLKYFSQMATTAFQTSIEERFLYYVNVLEDCGAREFEKSAKEREKAAAQAKIAEQKAKQEAEVEKKKKKKRIFGKNKDK